MNFSELDKQHMKIALDEANQALQENNYPVGAILVINQKIIDRAHNMFHTKKARNAHAEYFLLHENSQIIWKQLKKKPFSKVELFTTLEPCLMCLGAAWINKISRIVFACPDPHGGVTSLNPEILPKVYQDTWPQIQGGLHKEASYDLVCEFLKKSTTPNAPTILSCFEHMKKGWASTKSEKPL
ncbi:MAG: nucleoside deaminase [Candidatus Hodarchaeota archaeon]